MGNIIHAATAIQDVDTTNSEPLAKVVNQYTQKEVAKIVELAEMGYDEGEG